MADKDSEKKTTSEKPVSLALLNFKEVLEALLKVEPKENSERNKEAQRLGWTSCIN